MASGRNGTIYTGVTANLLRRAWEHREGQLDDFQRNTVVKFSSGMKSMRRWKLQSCERNKSKVVAGAKNLNL
jgi:hypothetical protein